MNLEKELFSEDFELVTESSFRSPDSELTPNAQPSSTLGNHCVNSADKDECQSSSMMTKSKSIVTPTMDPYQTFELIHNEHQALKEELLAQQDILIQQRSALETQKQKNSKELGELKDQVAMLKIELGDKDQQLHDLESQIKSFKESSEKADELHAKLYSAEDQIKYLEEMVRQFQTDGFISVQPPMLTDAILAKELKEKEEHLEHLRAALVDKESSQIGVSEENLKLKEDIETLRNLIVALQTQVDNDRIDMEHMRNDYEKRIVSLNNEVSQYLQSRQQKNSSNSAVESSHSISTLSYGETHLPRVFECNRCKLRIANEDLFKQHVDRCPTIIDNID